jgi:anti-sigma B factor antagonist
MSAPSAKMLVFVGEKFACVKISGRANFTSSIDFRTLVNELRQKGFNYFVLDLGECTLMDSTFLGVLAGFGLKLSVTHGDKTERAIELRNANGRIVELLENLGVLHLFNSSNGPLAAPSSVEPSETPSSHPTREEITRACLEAHQTLMDINPENVPRFKEVAQFLAEDLKRLKANP